MAFGPESHNPRERRAYAHAVIAKFRQTGEFDDYEKATEAITAAGDSRKTLDSQFDEHLGGAERAINTKRRAEHNTYVESVFAEYTADPTHRLRTDLIMYSALRPERPEAVEVNEGVAKIHSHMKAFESEVWFGGGLQGQVQATDERGLSLKQDDLSALVYSIAGRTLITLSDTEKGSMVTLITAEDEKERRMGIQSVDATAPDAVALIDKMRGLNRSGRAHFSPDADIAII
jgi:hypothetical protein